jgi:GcrA cell cycle regulator
MSWTNERIDTLKKLWNDGQSASAIARRLGEVTRNAVIGKVHRLGLAGRRSLSRNPRASRPPSLFPARSPLKNISSRPRARRTCAQKPKRLRASPELAPAPDLPVTVETLTESTCRWPEGDPKLAGFHFCGRHKPQGPVPYCGHHAAIAYR